MELIVLHDGREEKLLVERHGEAWTVTVGDRTLTVDAVSAGGSVRSLLVDGRQFEVGVRALGDGRYQISSGGGLDEVTVIDPLTHLARQAHEKGGATGPHLVTAYMPGRVVEVLVGVGAPVHAGQGLVVLEAMKMENEIQADGDGVVRAVRVTAGQAVEGGDVLFEID